MKTKIVSIAALAATIVALAACSPISLAPAGPYAVGRSPSVTLDRPWNDVSALWLGKPKKMRLLSLDGLLLNRLYLSEGLVEGDFIVRPARREATTPVYAADMSITEQVEFVANSVTALDYERVETSAVRPLEIEGQRAVRFELAARTKEGLNIRGLGQVLKREDKLYVAIYLAPEEHYYQASLVSAEAAMSSMTF
ncbi:hypothetical protein [Brevundimonas sp. TWP2-3-2]|uniref:hypothetical protein n=1 Tax=Brevundimonas sp. TWP2-3-2 TaxID=2804648 RepID=UPI003CF3566B